MTFVRDRAAAERAGLDLRAVLADPTTRVLRIVGDRVLVQDPDTDHPRLSIEAGRPGDVDAAVVVFLGRGADGVPLVAVAEDGEAPADAEDAAWRTLREVGPWLETSDLADFTTAQAMVMWHRTHRFCARCGSPTEPQTAGWVRRCPVEDREIYPRTDPAVIMAIRDDSDRLLLARGPQWAPGRRSVLAGFVEPGESLEDAVRREVAEEVGVTVGDVSYHGSQSWPFPASLMLGFHGRATTSDIRPDPVEIAGADWYTRDRVRAEVASGALALPGRMSIARALVESWLGGPIHVPGVDDPGVR